MAIHPRDLRSNNPRLQCTVCGKWKRLHTRKGQTFYGSCNHTGGDHVAGKDNDVCDSCCKTECKRIHESQN